jgi:hypothetical protein
VIFSVGKNGKGGLLHESGSRIPNPAAGTDEYLNLGLDSNDANNKKKISRTTTAGGGGCNDSTEGSSFCEFDDLVAWIPTTTIINRMVSAGRLP